MRCEIFEARVDAFKVVVADELRELTFGFVAVLVFGHLQFVLDCSKAGFGKRVVVAVISATHARPYSGSFKNLFVLLADVLTTAVGVVE